MLDKLDPSKMTDDDWKKRLTPEQYHILREKGTETPFSGGTLLHNTESGEYMCAACGTVIFTSDQKYDSTEPGLVGWPSFSAAAALADGSDAVELRDDDSFSMHRTEAVCKTCGSHLGHLFPDQSSPTGQHYCINCGSLDFKKS
jgi:peptide-methionine (R)-S-oxide reductase